MKRRILLLSSLLLIITLVSSCSGPKSYFTAEIRKKIEDNSIPPTALQFYVDRDVELRRDLSSGEVKVSSGKIKFENGKYIHIILLKKNTPGICTEAGGKYLSISFETGEGKNLKFGVVKDAAANAVYQIFAKEWIKKSSTEIGKITYDGQTYYIQPAGADASLMIQKKVVGKLEIKKRTMKGRKIK